HFVLQVAFLAPTAPAEGTNDDTDNLLALSGSLNVFSKVRHSSHLLTLLFVQASAPYRRRSRSPSASSWGQKAPKTVSKTTHSTPAASKAWLSPPAATLTRKPSRASVPARRAYASAASRSRHPSV